ncbi:MAG: DUF1566 domain-containing protein [Desulfatirhabdiaceae bacterium]
MDTHQFLNALNTSRFGGFDDWRLPTIQELELIIKRTVANPGPRIDIGFFGDTASPRYWSSTTVAQTVSCAWLINFQYGSMGNEAKHLRNHVRAVRNGQNDVPGFWVPPPGVNRYTDNQNETVTDSVTGLMWQKATSDQMNWKAALEYCEGLDLAGLFDWRLPNVHELPSILDYSRHDTAIDPVFPPSTIGSVYWTSTTGANSFTTAWGVGFSTGIVYEDWGKTLIDPHCRAVRGGQTYHEDRLFVTEPSHGMFLPVGQPITIRWKNRSIAGDVRITLSRDGGKNHETIAASVTNIGTYDWIVRPGSVNCMLKIMPLSNTDRGTIQGLFTIYAGQPVPGDVSGDGVLDMKDALLALQALAGLEPSELSLAGDVNGDGRIGMAEVIYVLQKISGL